MTDISTVTPKAVRRPNLQRPNISVLGIGTSLAAICSVMSNAFKLVYVAPYTNPHRQPRIVPDDDLEGRDPMW